MTITRRNYYDEMAVTVLPGKLNDIEVRNFTVDNTDIHSLRYQLQGRGCRNGTYTMLLRKGELWMSDTTAERYDHLAAAMKIGRGSRRVLIGGLGLGMILQVALNTPSVTHIDVVEIDPDVIALIGPHYADMAEVRGINLVFHTADLLKIRWPANTHWSVAWFDIWPHISADNLAEMSKLRRSYGRRAEWCECWGRKEALQQRVKERSRGW